ncbi:hypothetical protein DLAC_06125 [Tieghemostelium lacteum]|uniref:IPT/TIG domain-containing protein n=1 Tax=Tieghemostelium lacteum TaxID=361077 RepID=A0A151ZHW1_TIELA|nr:hypothetical protein DLAC_06125 [Tieghemostelium lacteum]|eukprot:KYQ93434.1 hypothetical protein DLAC_06125 [Tieghemostelium lacteum]
MQLRLTTIFLFVLFISLTNSIAILPQQEIDSLLWILQQYRVNIPSEISQGTCPSIPTNLTMTCTEFSGVLHITNLKVISSSSVSAINPQSLDQFYFPELTNLIIEGFSLPLSNGTLNVMKLMSNLPKLQKFLISRDSSLDRTYELTTSPMVQTIISSCPNLIDITPFLATLTGTLSVSLCASLDYSIFSNLPSPIQITELSIVDESTSTPLNVVINKSSYPNLVIIDIGLDGDNNVTINSDIINNLSIGRDSTNITLDLTNCPNIKTMQLTGEYTIIPANLTFTKLEVLEAEEFTSPDLYNIVALPDTFISLHVEANPSITKVSPLLSGLPKLKEIYYIDCANMVEEVGFYFNKNTTTFQLSLEGMDGITGVLPEDYCVASADSIFSFDNSPNFEGYPDCFKCYSSLISTTMELYPTPDTTGFTCVPTIESVTSVGFQPTVTVTGKNLGYGSTFYSDSRISVIEINNIITFNTTGLSTVPVENITLASNNVTLSGITWVSLNSMSNISIKQLPIGRSKVILSQLTYDPRLPVTVTFNNVNSTSNSTDGKLGFEFDFLLENSTNYSVKIINGISSNTINHIPFTLEYPIVDTISWTINGKYIKLTGYFGETLEEPSIEIDGQNCEVRSVESNQIICESSTSQKIGVATPYKVTIDGYSYGSTLLVQLPETSNNTDNDDSDKKKKIGAILGSILGAAFIAALVASIIWYRNRSKKLKKARSELRRSDTRQVFIGGKVQEMEQF